MEQSNNKTITTLLIVFIVLTLLLGGYIIYDKVLKKDVPVSETEKEKEKVQETSTLPEWANYILKQDITEIYYGYPKIVGETFECTTKTITKEQLKDILEKMTANKLRKYDMGGGGSDCNDEGITIKYGDKKFVIWKGRWIFLDTGNDPEVISLLEKANYVKEEPTNPEPAIVFEYIWDENYINTLLGIE